MRTTVKKKGEENSQHNGAEQRVKKPKRAGV
jgi:hypothetical protein